MLTLLTLMMKTLLMLISIMLAVGFLTLMERKILAYIQIRKGPNKVSMKGTPQPLADAIKLFTKENPNINVSLKPLYLITPVGAMVIMFMLWSLYISSNTINSMKLTIMYFIIISSTNVYMILLSGWSSNSKYSLLGAVRAIAQTISYEISMTLVIMAILMMPLSFTLKEIFYSQIYTGFAFTTMPIFLIWTITILAETNRAPFDLSEGESELVSGFNVEYGSGEFALLFIAEYGSILLLSMVTSCVFLASHMSNMGITSMIKTMLITYLFLWVRSTYPRMRYDNLMSLTWKTFLTTTITMTTLLMVYMFY